VTPGLLLGRETELGRLTELIDDLGASGSGLIVRGDAGIGKSALLAAAAAHARSTGVRVLTAGGIESEQHLAYAGLHQLVYPIRAGINQLSASQRDALSAAMGTGDFEVFDVYMVGLAVLNLVAEVAGRSPVLMVVEDAHWLDRASADVLAFVSRRLESEPILLLVAVRDGAPSRMDDEGLPALTLQPLPKGPAAALLDAHAPGLSRALRQRCLEAAAGNPLALTELPNTAHALVGAVRTTASAVPLTARLERAFSDRVLKLGPETRTALLVAALNDSASVSEVVEAATVVSGRAVGVSELAPAVTAQLIDLVDGEVSFRHPLMRSAIQQSATMLERHAAHAALATVLEADMDRRAWHRAAAATGTDDSVASELESAARRTQRRGGVLMAVATLERSARLTSDPALRTERLLHAADLAVESGRQDIVLRLLDEVAPSVSSPQQRARELWLRGSFDDGIRDETEGAVVLANLADEVAAGGDVELAMRILWSAALRCFWSEPGDAARRLVVDVAESVAPDDFDPRLLAVLAYAHPLERGAIVMDRMRQLAGNPRKEAQDSRLLGTAAVVVGEFVLATKLSSASTVGLRAQGRLGLLARALSAQAYGLVRLADLATAIPTIDEAGRLDLETTQPMMYATVRAAEAELSALRGDYDRAYELAAEAERAALPVGARPVLATIQCARGVAALGEGRFTDAYGHLRRMHDPADPAYHVALRCYAIAELAEAAARSGNADGIAEIMRDLEAISRMTPAPALHVGLRYARAVLAPDDAAQQLFEAALNADLTGWPFARARTQLAFGEWLRRRRQVVESRVHLRAARATFDALGVIPWSERARQELRAAGETSARRTPDARDQLTPHELHIAQLAADGLTNREIGQKLYLSHRTVSSHLYRIFPKLDITSRAELRSVVLPTA
jgi:DNA-binding CsgD family transcriptional regulator/tetratricopeptide (TPR) repeat protein